MIRICPPIRLSYELLIAPAGASITSGGEFSWTPTIAQGSAEHTASIEVCDGGNPEYCDQETFSIFVNENHAPVAIDLSYATKENEGGTVPASLGVVHFATDEDGDPMTAVLVADAAHGTLTLNSDGSFSYYPFANFDGTDSFVYKVNDGYVNSNSATATIIVDPIQVKPPSTPVLLSPGKNALMSDLKPRLDWKNSSLPSGTIFDHYLLQVARDNQFTDLVLEQSFTDITESEYTFQTELQRNMKYYWRVMAFNSNNSNWSEVWYFRESILTPELTAPANAALPDNLRPLFDWQDVDGASSYKFQISTNSNMSGPFLSKNVPDSEYLPNSDLPTGKTLYWWVRANGDNGPSDWSEVRMLSTPAPPSRPSLKSPANKVLLTDRQPTLIWSSVSLMSGTAFDYYQLQVADNSDFDSPVLDINVIGQFNTNYIFDSPLEPNTVYHWRVRAFNTAGHYRSWSEVRYFREAMLPPALSTPADGALTDHLRPMLDWQDVDGASSYRIQISTKSSMGRPFVNTNVIGSEYLPTSDLPNTATLYWRVRANGDNGPSAWSEVWMLMTPAPPSQPKLLTPGSNALVTVLRPLLDWGSSSVPAGTIFDHYQLQVAKDSGFASPVIDQDLAASEYTPDTDLEPNTAYFWRVKAFNTIGQYSSWSEERIFREAMLVPELTAPVDSALPDTLRPLFDWQDVEGASSYKMQVSVDSTMKKPFISKNVTDSEYLPTSDLPTGRFLYWRVRAEGENGPSAWSEVWMMTSPSPPSRPSLLSPGNKSLVTDLFPRLDWSTSSPMNGTVFDHYQLQVADNINFTAPVVDTNIDDLLNSEYIVADPLLQPNTMYFWRVRAFNTAGEYRSWSDAWYFREAMLPPEIVAPADGAQLDNQRPLLDWQDVNGASSYSIQISTRSNMKRPFIKKNVTGSEYLPTSDLPKNKVLYWCVRANGDNGPSAWSEVRSMFVFLP